MLFEDVQLKRYQLVHLLGRGGMGDRISSTSAKITSLILHQKAILTPHLTLALINPTWWQSLKMVVTSTCI
jgi:hypothetical protein